MIDKKKNDLYQIKYYWDIKFKFGKKRAFSPIRVKTIQKINDYEKNFFPIFKMELLINDRYFNLIFQEQKRMKCIVKLYKKYFNPEANDKESSDTAPIKEEKIMEDEFIAFFNKIPGDVVDTDTLATAEETENEKSDEKDVDSLGSITSSNVTVTLWHVGSLKSYKKYTNMLLVNANVGTAIGYLLNSYNEIKTAIVDIPDNTVKYQELFLLPYGLRNSFYSLQYRYGIYANGLWAFFDNTRFYLLKALSVNHQYEQGKGRCTTIRLKKNPGSIVAPFICGINKTDKNHTYEATGVLQKQNLDVIMGEVYGDSLVYTNFDKIVSSMVVENGALKSVSPLEILEREKLSHEDSGAKLEMEYDSLNNPYNLMSRMRSESLNMIVPVIVKGADLESFTPEKIVNLEILDDLSASRQYGGEYCIRNVVYVFAPEIDGKINRSIGGSILFETTGVAQVSLSRVPKDLLSN